MQLSTILSQARSGELKSLSTKDKTDETIINFINLGLIDLYGRFQVKVEEAIISLQVGKTLYTLGPSDTDVTVNGSPMIEDDVMYITEAYDEKGRIHLNAQDDPYAIHTPSYNTVQVPLTASDSYISVIYKKNPTAVVFVDNGSGGAVDAVIDLPQQLLIPILHFIGYRAHGAVNGNVQAENNTHLQRYEASCRRVIELGLMTADDLYRDNSNTGFLV